MSSPTRAGRVLAVRVTSARKGDSPEAGPTLSQARVRFGELETVVADQGYQAQAGAAATRLGLALQVVKKESARRAFKCSPGARVIERTRSTSLRERLFAW